MEKSFAKLPSPVVVGVIRERTVRGAIAAIKKSEISGATALDLHLSCLEEKERTAAEIRKIADSTKLPILALNYNENYDWSPAGMTEEERVDLLLTALDGGCAAIDMQGYTFDPKSKSGYYGDKTRLFSRDNPREIVTDESVINKQKELIERVHGMGKEVLLSTHPYVPMDTEQLLELAKFLDERNPDVIKIVTRCDTEEQLGEAFKSMIALKNAGLKARISFHCCGQKGKPSRIINPLLGSYLCFCTPEFTESSNFEQLPLALTAETFDNLKKIL